MASFSFIILPKYAPLIIIAVIIGGIVLFGFRYLVGTEKKFYPFLEKIAAKQSLIQASGSTWERNTLIDPVVFKWQNDEFGDQLLYVRGNPKDMFDRTIETIHRYGPSSTTQDHIIVYKRLCKQSDSVEKHDSPEIPYFDENGIILINQGHFMLTDEVSDFLRSNKMNFIQQKLDGKVVISFEREEFILYFYPPYFSKKVAGSLAKYIDFVNFWADHYCPRSFPSEKN